MGVNTTKRPPTLHRWGRNKNEGDHQQTLGEEWTNTREILGRWEMDNDGMISTSKMLHIQSNKIKIKIKVNSYLQTKHIFKKN